jgi:hypothetical protein
MATLGAGAIVMIAAGVAHANGINPPRLKGASVIAASCVERSTQAQRDFLRARITTGDQSSDVLDVRTGDAREEVAIREIASILLTATPVDKDGFVDGSLTRRDASTPEKVAVKVRTRDAAVRLAGFSDAGSTVTIDLAKCERIDFGEPPRDGNAPSPPVLRK